MLYIRTENGRGDVKRCATLGSSWGGAWALQSLIVIDTGLCVCFAGKCGKGPGLGELLLRVLQMIYSCYTTDAAAAVAARLGSA